MANSIIVKAEWDAEAKVLAVLSDLIELNGMNSVDSALPQTCALPRTGLSLPKSPLPNRESPACAPDPSDSR